MSYEVKFKYFLEFIQGAEVEGNERGSKFRVKLQLDFGDIELNC